MYMTYLSLSFSTKEKNFTYYSVKEKDKSYAYLKAWSNLLSFSLPMDSKERSSIKFPSMGIEGEEEFQEEDVWSVLRGESSSPEMKISKSHISSSSSPWHIHRSKEISGVKQSSAPMNVPDWSKVYGNTKSNRKSSHNLHSHDDDDCCMVPPHEWVARKLARTQISSFSMCEGIGRTLKGRDLSKVRNAVLTKTGFLE